MIVSSRWVFRPMVSTFDSNCAASAQLFGCHLVEIGRGSHAVDFTKAINLPQLKSKAKSL